jgi:hypothetical protein
MDHVGLRRGRRTAQAGGAEPVRPWLYLESHGGVDRWLHVRCPCGCGDVISLSLLKYHFPSWSLTWHRDGTLSVAPAVWNGRGCGSCFSIEKGEVRWAGGSRRTAETSVGLPAERVRPRRERHTGLAWGEYGA